MEPEAYFELHKLQEISSLAEILLDFVEGFFCMEF